MSKGTGMPGEQSWDTRMTNGAMGECTVWELVMRIAREDLQPNEVRQAIGYTAVYTETKPGHKKTPAM